MAKTSFVAKPSSGLKSELEMSAISLWGDVDLPYVHVVKEMLIGLFGSERLNLDVIETRLIDVSGGGYDLAYGNLYTYVLMQGICVPYYEWIYSFAYYDSGQNMVYLFDGETGRGQKMIGRTPNDPRTYAA